MSEKKLGLIAAWSLVILIAALLLSPLRSKHPHDFMLMYFAGRLADSGQISQLYSKPAYQPLIAELRATGEPMSTIDAHYFLRPAFAAFFFAPFSRLPYPAASWLWTGLNLVVWGVLVWKLPIWFSIPSSVRPWLFGFYPFPYSIGFGQDTLLLTLTVAYSLRLASRGKDAAAGALLGTTVYKPHLVWLLPLALAAAGRWRMAAAFVAVGGALAAVSVAAVGTAGLRNYIDLVRAPSSDYLPHTMGNLRALWLQLGPTAGVIASILVLACLLVVLRWGSQGDKISAAFLTALLVSPHTYPQDYCLMAVVAMLAGHPVPRWLLLLPWPYLFIGRKDLLIFVFVSLGYLCFLAVRPLLRRPAEAA